MMTDRVAIYGETEYSHVPASALPALIDRGLIVVEGAFDDGDPYYRVQDDGPDGGAVWSDIEHLTTLHPCADPRDHAPCGCGHLAHDHDGETCHGTAGTMIGQTADESGMEPDLPCLCTAYGAPR